MSLQEETFYELAYQTETSEGTEWKDYGRTTGLEAAQTVVKEMIEQTTYKEWEIRKVTIRVEIVE